MRLDKKQLLKWLIENDACGAAVQWIRQCKNPREAYSQIVSGKIKYNPIVDSYYTMEWLCMKLGYSKSFYRVVDQFNNACGRSYICCCDSCRPNTSELNDDWTRRLKKAFPYEKLRDKIAKKMKA